MSYCTPDNQYVPTVQNFKTYFNRDFPYGTDIQTSVTDVDIEKAINMAQCNINQALFCDTDCFSVAFLLLSAHYLVVNLTNSSQGLSGQFAWLVSSKSVGNVSVGMTIPDYILSQPLLAMLSRTTYGAQYLELILPLITGHTFAVPGRTLP